MSYRRLLLLAALLLLFVFGGGCSYFQGRAAPYRPAGGVVSPGAASLRETVEFVPVPVTSTARAGGARLPTPLT